MKRSVEELEGNQKLPFGMNFMESPTDDDTMLPSSMSTGTERYSTTSGPSHGLDDGQTVTRDD